MVNINQLQLHQSSSKDDIENDATAPFYETEVFHSIWDALRWKHIRTRVPICFKKTLRSRYMLANLVYLCYTIGFLVADFHFNMNISTDITSNISDTMSTTTIPILEQLAGEPAVVNKMFFSFSIVHLASACLYWWAWDNRSWLDVIMIPEYLNMIEAGLYIWSTSWYPRLDALGGHYTMTIHKIETTAGFIDLLATFGWIMSWYRTYTRTLGRGFSLDDPDVIAFTSTMIGSSIYVAYNLRIITHPEEYNTNTLYTYGDILFFLGACFYIFASMRDLNWFWFLPFAGQYGVPAGTINVESKVLPQFGRPAILMTDCCRKRSKKSIKHQVSTVDSNVIITCH